MTENKKTPIYTNDWVQEETAAEMLGIKKRTLQHYVCVGRIPMKAIKKNIIGKRQYHAPTLKSPSNN